MELEEWGVSPCLPNSTVNLNMNLRKYIKRKRCLFIYNVTVLCYDGRKE